MDKVLAKEILFDIKKVFEKYNITFWLDCGTLLGAMREKDFIAWDKNDIDVGMYRPIFLNLELWRNLLIDLNKRNITPYTVWNNSVFTCKRDAFMIDTHIVKKRDKEYFMEMNGILFHFPEKIFDQLDEIIFLGEKFNVPHNPEEYLNMLYGNDWKEPHPEGNIWKSKYSQPFPHDVLLNYIRYIPIYKEG